MAKTAPPAPSSPAGPPRLVAESGLDGVGGFDSASTPPPPDPFGALTVPDKPGPPPVGGPGSVMAEGGPAAAGCEEDEPMKDLVAAPAYKLAAETSADMVFPTSPRTILLATILLARKGIKAIAIENKTQRVNGARHSWFRLVSSLAPAPISSFSAGKPSKSWAEVCAEREEKMRQPAPSFELTP